MSSRKYLSAMFQLTFLQNLVECAVECVLFTLLTEIWLHIKMFPSWQVILNPPLGHARFPLLAHRVKYLLVCYTKRFSMSFEACCLKCGDSLLA